jgi:hypothetical protein
MSRHELIDAGLKVGADSTAASLDFGRRHWVTGVVSLLVSSIMPLLIEWHAEKQVDDAIASAEKAALAECASVEARANASRLELKSDFETQLHDQQAAYTLELLKRDVDAAQSRATIWKAVEDKNKKQN